MPIQKGQFLKGCCSKPTKVLKAPRLFLPGIQQVFFNYKLDCIGGKTKQVLTQPAFASLLAYTILGTQAR